MIDVHVLTHSGTRADWLDQCLESLAREPCLVHVVAGVEGNIAAGREVGFGLGAQPFVTFVDSDDYVLPGAMDAMCEALQRAPAACARELVLTEDGQLHGPFMKHHLFALRRETLAPHLAGYGKRFAREHCVTALASICRPLEIDAITYIWRQHQQQSHRSFGSWPICH